LGRTTPPLPLHKFIIMIDFIEYQHKVEEELLAAVEEILYYSDDPFLGIAINISHPENVLVCQEEEIKDNKDFKWMAVSLFTKKEKDGREEPSSISITKIAKKYLNRSNQTSLH